MRLETTDGTVMLHFHYPPQGKMRSVTCTIHRGSCVQPTRPCTNGLQGFGYAICDPRDMFVKSTGRKLALARALKDLEVPRNERTIIWAAYLEKVGMK